jgi:hypothetical protein
MWASPLKTQQEVTKLGEEKHDEAQRGEQSRVIMADGSTHSDRQWVCGLGEYVRCCPSRQDRGDNSRLASFHRRVLYCFTPMQWPATRTSLITFVAEATQSRVA